MPKYDLNSAPHMHIGMGVEAAKHSGYVKGYLGLDTPWVCCLTIGAEERGAWMDAYREGERDAGQTPYEPFPTY